MGALPSQRAPANRIPRSPAGCPSVGSHSAAHAQEVPMEHWEALTPDGLRFVYDDGLFRPGTDTFLLSSLPRLRPGLRVCDLGCGTGLLGLLLLQRQPELQVTGVDILPEAVALARKAAAENRLTDRLTFQLGDLRESAFPAGSFDLILSNPPYFPVNAGTSAGSARSEECCTLEELCAAAARLVKNGGRFALCHRPERLTDVLCTLRAHGLEPKRLKLIAHSPAHPPSLILVEALRQGKPGLAIEIGSMV